MEPEESDPGLLVGRHVVEIGRRQAWQFLTVADPETGREVRVYVDAPLTVTSGAQMGQEEPGFLRALDELNLRTITAADVVDGTLVLQVDGVEVRVSGESDDLTSGSPWWIGMQAPGSAATEKAAETRFGADFRLSLQRALWGMITPSVHAIALGWDDGVGRARFVFDDVPGEDERELVAEVETEVIADFGEAGVFAFTTDVSLADRPRLEPGERWWAYLRYEQPQRGPSPAARPARRR